MKIVEAGFKNPKYKILDKELKVVLSLVVGILIVEHLRIIEEFF